MSPVGFYAEILFPQTRFKCEQLVHSATNQRFQR